MPRTAHHTSPAKPSNDLPRPHLSITPAKAGFPADGGQLDLLVTVGVDLPNETVARKPIALSLVLDRSGSMSGEPLEAAKAAACAAIEMLLPDDWVAVVAFDSYVNVVAPLAAAGLDRSALLNAVKALDPGGSTALFGGWAEGLSQVMSCPVADAGARVVLLSDGGANVGVSDAPSIAADVSRAATHGVTTTSMGFGRHYDENLMRAMADAGQGNYVFIEGEAQVAEAFQQELAGLSALRGRNVRLEPTVGVSLASAVSGRLSSIGNGVRLPDLIAGLDRDLVLTATFAAGVVNPEISLVWSDLLTGIEERLSAALDLVPLSREAFEELPTDQGVTTQMALARIANTKFELSQAFRSGHVGETARLLGELEAAVAALPVGAERTSEEGELARLRDLEQAKDVAMAARYSERKARDRAFGTSDLKRSAQFDKERELFEKKTQFQEAAPHTVGEQQRAPRSAPRHTSARRTAARQAVARQPLASVVLAGSQGPVNVQVLIDDITTQDVDVLVNSTNRRLFGNAGVDGAVHRSGGPELTQAARQIGGLDFGQAAFTPGFRLPARYVVHAVALPWQGGSAGEANALEQAYRSAFDVARKLGARSLAVAALGTGSNGVPLEIATRAALSTLRKAVSAGAPFSDVRFVALDASVANAFALALPNLPAAGVIAEVN